MERKVFNKLVRDNIPNKISKNGEYYSIRTLSDEEFEEAVDKKLIEELDEVLSAKTKDELKEELADLMEMVLTKAEINNITFGDINRLRIKKINKIGAFNNKIFLISTVDKEYIENNRGCKICVNGNCTLPTSEKYDYEDDGKPAGYYCIGYKSAYK